MAVNRLMRVLGFMTGTSLDAVDMAVVDTDGEAIFALGPCGERDLTSGTREIVLNATDAARAWPRGAPRPAVFDMAARAVAAEHASAARDFLERHGEAVGKLDLIGVHGQTILHEPPTKAEPIGRTIQLIDAPWLADALGLPVAYDFRTADVAAGGQGAPLAPIYHVALAKWSGLQPPFAVLNIGGVANITFVGLDGAITAFDTGPGNGMIDLMVQARGLGRYDAGGALALAGEFDPEAMSLYLDHPYLTAPPPKSLDRYTFSLDPVAGLPDAVAASTLTAFAVAAVALSPIWMQEGDRPRSIIVAGGGRHNPALMNGLRAAMAGTRIVSADDAGWRGDAVEAEAFAYLAARTVNRLPISFPRTTGVKAPMRGGRVAMPGAGAL